MEKDDLDDPFRRLNYRRLIAWESRITREAPLLDALLADAPEKSVLDLGCGTGEHARHFADRGAAVLGVDRSDAQIEKAREYTGDDGNPAFACGDFTELPRLTDRRFGLAICLGNALPYLEDDEMDAMLSGLAATLLPGGRLLIQLLNYQRIRDQQIRSLPVNMRPHPDLPGAEIVFLRLMTTDGPDHILFHPTTLTLRPGTEPAVTVENTREARLRSWTWTELAPHVERAGFDEVTALGDFARTPFCPESSHDLLLLARRAR